ncbi:MAG: Transcriptional regulator/sugar kinase [Clostridiales bacterium]|nr:Transcriptional regulator/sugar kinase [Clostridiales bacterium]
MNEKKYYLGVDIGGTAIKIGLVDDYGNVLHEATYSDDFDQYETPILDTVLKSTDLFLKQQKILIKDLYGIGVSATGLIDERNGRVIGAADHLKNWNGSRIKDRMQERYHLPVTVVNDANCAALGEFFIGAAKGVPNVIVVTVGTGIGGGIIVNSQLLMGAQGLSGEIGNIIINYEDLESENNIGYYEKYAATTALVRMVKDGIKKGVISGLDEADANGRTIFNSVKYGNNALQEVIDEWIGYVATGVVSLVHIFNPDLILIGGGVSTQKELFVDKLREKVLSTVMPAYRDELRLEPTALGNKAGLVGAVYYCMNHKDKK